MSGKGKILIIDDNEDILFALNAFLAPEGFTVRVSADPMRIPSLMNSFSPEVILLDMNFRRDAISGAEGFDWLARILSDDPDAAVVMMTAYGDMTKAVRAIKEGATDFISKPWENDRLLATLNSAVNLSRAKKEQHTLRSQVALLSGNGQPMMVGESPAIREVISTIEKLSGTEANVFISGENGTGKDLAARLLHHISPRAGNAFVTIDLGSISDSLFESELFGHEKGAFTDAKSMKQGRMETASGGTLFLDEIGNLSLPMQSKLLTAIEKKYITRLGSTKNIEIDVRLITASNSDLYKAVEAGTFRQDLLYRINTIEVHIPPLRERGKDVELLAEHFLEKFRRKYKKDALRFSADALRKLSSYRWPGNVRELQNVIERSVIMSSGRQLTAADMLLSVPVKPGKEEELNLEKLELQAIDKAVRISNGNLSRAAEMLGITRYALYRKLKKNE